MPVFNCMKYVQEAIDSILGQTEGDFEFLIVDDASTDGTLEIIEQQKDPRIRIIRNEFNCGLASGLNTILSQARGKYIARMDGDDISLERRFELQSRFLESHPEIALVGSYFTFFECKDKGDICIKRRPERPLEIGCLLGIASQVCHPSAMYLREAAIEVGGYRPKIGIAEDYDLWLRLRERWLLANLPEVLHRVRWHEQRISNRRLMDQVAFSKLCLMLDYERKVLGEDSLDLMTHDDIGTVLGGGVPIPRKGPADIRKRIHRNWKRISYWHDPRCPEVGLLRRLARWPYDLGAWQILLTLIKVRVRWKMRPITLHLPSGELLKA